MLIHHPRTVRALAAATVVPGPAPGSWADQANKIFGVHPSTSYLPVGSGGSNIAPQPSHLVQSPAAPRFIGPPTPAPSAPPRPIHLGPPPRPGTTVGPAAGAGGALFNPGGASDFYGAGVDTPLPTGAAAAGGKPPWMAWLMLGVSVYSAMR
jgi:hypothetical protein